MRILYLLRHSLVDRDSERLELSSEGQELAVRCGSWLLAGGYPLPERMYASDRPRATQSASFIAQGMRRGISELHDTRNEGPEIILPGEWRSADGLILTVDNRLEEENPPSELQAAQEYLTLMAEQKRAALLLDWPGKHDKIRLFVAAIKEIMQKNQSALVVSHAQVIQSFLQEQFQGSLDLASLNIATPHLGITILIEEEGILKLNRLFFTDWKHELQEERSS